MVNEERNNTCDNILPLVEWIKEVSEKLCRSCVLPLLAAWYKSELEENGNADLSTRITELAGKVDLTPEELAKELDNIKDVVKDEKLRLRLREFDCAVQKNEGEK